MKKIYRIILISLLVIISSLTLVSCTEVTDSIGPVSFFPDGKTILFSAHRNAISNIYTYNLLTKKLEMLTSNSNPKYSYYTPVISSDGSRIVFAGITNEFNEGSHIYIMHVDGSNIRQLTNEHSWDVGPVFSPDGKEIVFFKGARYRHTSTGGETWSDWDIYSVKIDGTNLQKITNRQFMGGGGLSMPPDRKSILFSATPMLRDPVSKKYPDFSSFIFLIDQYNPEPIEPLALIESYANFSPSFSPDGNKIVFISFTKLKGRGYFDYNVFTMDSDGKNVKQITDNQSSNLAPSFSPDMKTIFFLSDIERNHNNKLMQVNADGTNLHEIKIFDK